MKEEFIEQSIFRLKESEERIHKCLNELSEEQIWQRPNSNLSSIGNLTLHVCGNMTQYIYASLGKNPDLRDRDNEFESSDIPLNQLKETLDNSFDKIYQVLNEVDTEELNRLRSVQGFDLTGIGIIIHVVEHLSYHTGQITYWTKYLINKDLGYYANLDLNLKNK